MTEHLKSAPVAYQNEPFLNSPDGRILRILAEYIEPLARFRREQIQDTVVFYGSARLLSKSDAERQLASTKASHVDGHSPHVLERAIASVDMSRYYEEARRLAFL